MKAILFFSCIFIMMVDLYASQFNHLKQKVIDIDSDEFIPEGPWLISRQDEKKRIKYLISILKKSKTGRMLLQKAEKKASQEEVMTISLFKAGDGSLLDTTLVRRFSQSRPEEIVYENRSTIYINRHHSLLNAVLDMAHELTHYTFRKSFNPYIGEFTADQFIKSTVEGHGGEVDAYLIECKVLYELFPRSAKRSSNCEKVKDEAGRLSKKLGIRQFYRIGNHDRSYTKELSLFNLSKDYFPHLSSHSAIFISSAWGLPYPLAALKEYRVIMGKVCRNDQKRLALMEKKINRSPASIQDGRSSQLYFESFNKNYQARCQQFI